MMKMSRAAAVLLCTLSMTGCAMFGWGESEPAAAPAEPAAAAPAAAAPATTAPAPVKKKSKKAATTSEK